MLTEHTYETVADVILLVGWVETEKHTLLTAEDRDSHVLGVLALQHPVAVEEQETLLAEQIFHHGGHAFGLRVVLINFLPSRHGKVDLLHVFDYYLSTILCVVSLVQLPDKIPLSRKGPQSLQMLELGHDRRVFSVCNSLGRRSGNAALISELPILEHDVVVGSIELSSDVLESLGGLKAVAFL